jgi:HAD superfamily hydrolase (TIGR01509 family)
MKIDGAIFDLDGTLLDSMPVWATLGTDYLNTLGIRPPSDIAETIKLMTLRQTAEYFKSECGVALPVPEIENGINEMVESQYFHEVRPKPGTAEFLDALHRQGAKMCVVTATDRYLVEAALSRCGLLDRFERIITCGDFGAGKDQPDIFEYALEALGTEKACTPVFEDAIHAAKTAKDAGFPLVAVYDRSFAESETALRELADIYVNSLGDLLCLKS